MKILKTEYFKNIYNQAILVFIAQLIPIIFSPIIARLYDENAIAEITGLISFSSILLVFSSLKLENAIVLEKDNEKAKQIVVLVVLLTLIYTLVSFFGISTFKNEITKVFKINKVINYVPIYILSYSLLNILNFWFVRVKKFKLKAYSKLIESISYILFLISLYYIIGYNHFGLALGKIFGVSVALIILYKYSALKLKKTQFKTFKSILIKYRDFPLHNAPSNFVNVIGLQLIVLFIGIYFSKENFGYFGLANMIILLPISFISQSVGSVFFQKISENFISKNYKQLKKTFYQTLTLLALIGFSAFLVIYFGSEYIFTTVYGENWLISGKIAKILSIVFLFQMTISPLGVLLIAINKVKINAYWQYGRFVFMTILMFLLLNEFKVSFLSFIYYYSFAVAFVYIVYLVIMITELKKLRIKQI